MQMVARMNAAGLVPIISSDNRMSASNAGLKANMPCALPEDILVSALQGLTWARFYENWPSSFWVPGGEDLEAGMIANAILEAQAGIAFLAHAPVSSPCNN